MIVNYEYMAKYFANGNRLRPPKWEDAGAPKDEVVGVFNGWSRRNSSKLYSDWFVVKVTTDDGLTEVYFKDSGIRFLPDRYLDSLIGKRVRVSSEYDVPVLEAIGVTSENEIRESLLKGVLEGRIDREDLPALVQFAKGDDSGFERWRLFLEENQNKELGDTKEKILREHDSLVSYIDSIKKKIERLDGLYKEVSDESRKIERDLDAKLVLLKGDCSLEGLYPCSSERLVWIRKGYQNLSEAVEKFRTRDGIYVLCDGKVHLIEYAYFDDQNRAFLIGKSREYLRAQPEKMKFLISSIQSAIRGVKEE